MPSAGDGVPDDDRALATLLELIDLYGGNLDSLWDRFSMYNLATGNRAGELESYRDAASMRGLAVGEIDLSAGVDATGTTL